MYFQTIWDFGSWIFCNYYIILLFFMDSEWTKPTVLYESGGSEVGREGRLDQVPGVWVLQGGQQVLLTCCLHLLGHLRVKGQCKRAETMTHGTVWVKSHVGYVSLYVVNSWCISWLAGVECSQWGLTMLITHLIHIMFIIMITLLYLLIEAFAIKWVQTVIIIIMSLLLLLQALLIPIVNTHLVNGSEKTYLLSLLTSLEHSTDGQFWSSRPATNKHGQFIFPT